MQKSDSQKIRLGIFIVLGTILLVSALYFIGNRQNLFGNNLVLHAEFANVNGLQLGNNVRFSGINTGTVKDINMLNSNRIIVSMIIDEEIANQIKKNAVATIGSDGLVGSMLINIIPQEGESLPVSSGDTIASYTKIGANDILSTLSVTNENAAILTSDLLKITTKILEGKGTLGMLISDTILAQNLKQGIFELKEASENANNTIARLNDLAASMSMDESVAGVLFNDSIAAQTLKNVITDLEKSSTHINDMTQNMSTYLEEIKESDGTLNKLIHDEGFAEELDSTMGNIKEASNRLNQNMEALKHNFLFRGYFRKLERQEKRRIRDSLRNLKN